MTSPSVEAFHKVSRLLVLQAKKQLSRMIRLLIPEMLYINLQNENNRNHLS